MFIADQTEWHLRLYPHGYNEADGYISCDLKMVSKQKVMVAFTISIVCADGLEHFSVEKVDQQFPNDTFAGPMHFCRDR
ncbi:hypothetical protein CEXT_648741 [Caerostris extrusa]|uniref:MATH domain-containing protein n=1 Tax=Caerostris extrusa TaxID=172846 RepID=A0AAV4M907_CAEEX|nr:hypothetical protein CEXT_648741 [Caerostris extrusa]